MKQQLMMEPKYTLDRTEDRIVMKPTVLLVGRHKKLGVENAITEVLSSWGVGAISKSEWYVDDTILVSLPAEHFTSAARVIRCDAIGGGLFRMALEFVGASETLELTSPPIAAEA